MNESDILSLMSVKPVDDSAICLCIDLYVSKTKQIAETIGTQTSEIEIEDRSRQRMHCISYACKIH